MELGQLILIWVAIFVVIAIFVTIKSHINTKKGMDSEEKQEIKDLAAKLIPNVSEYTVAYGYWETRQISAGGVATINTTNTYYYYAVAFKSGILYYIPLSFAGGDMSYGEVCRLSKDDLGMVNGKKNECWASYYDKEKNEIVSISVLPSNTKDDKYNPCNIQQQEESEAYVAFVQELMEDVNTANGVEVTGKPLKPLKK